ncbi:hypothetical protein AgCh_022341 [Apium graveolens]
MMSVNGLQRWLMQILTHNMVNTMFNLFASLKLLCITETRFASVTIMLMSFELLKHVLERLVICEELSACPEYDLPIAQIMRIMILDEYWWDKEELDWNEMLIKRYTGREALWLYRRFLALYWINQFVADVADALPHSNLTPISTSEIKTFLDNELQLFYSCQVFSINDFDDYRAQATFSSTYMLWITRHFSQYPGIEPILELRPRDLREVLEKNCPERSCLWNSFRTP